MLIVLLLWSVLQLVRVSEKGKGLPFYISMDEPYKGDLLLTRGRERDLLPQVDVVGLL